MLACALAYNDVRRHFFGLPLAIKFFQRLGIDRVTARAHAYTHQLFLTRTALAQVMAHNHGLAVASAKRCAERWQTRLLCDERVFNCMATVRLPRLQLAAPSGALAGAIRALLRDRYDIELPVLFVNGELCARLSAHVYYQPSDYDLLIDTVLRLEQLHAADLRARLAS